MQTELIKVDALPPDRDLDHTLHLTQRAGARHQHAPPHHRADPEQPNLDLHDLGRVGIGRGRGWFNVSVAADPHSGRGQGGRILPCSRGGHGASPCEMPGIKTGTMARAIDGSIWTMATICAKSSYRVVATRCCWSPAVPTGMEPVARKTAGFLVSIQLN